MTRLAIASIAGGILVAATIVATLPPGPREIAVMMAIMLVTVIAVAAVLAVLPWIMQHVFGYRTAIWTARFEKVSVCAFVAYLIGSLYKECSQCPHCGVVNGQTIDNDPDCFAFIASLLPAAVFLFSAYSMLESSQKRLTKRFGWTTSSAQGT